MGDEIDFTDVVDTIIEQEELQELWEIFETNVPTSRKEKIVTTMQCCNINILGDNYIFTFSYREHTTYVNIPRTDERQSIPIEGARKEGAVNLIEKIEGEKTEK